MEKILLLNIIIASLISIYFYKKELKHSYIPMIFSNVIIILLNYPIVGQSNFISKTFVLFIVTMSIVHIYLRYYHYEHYTLYVPNPFIHFIFTAINSIAIPFILATSHQSLYQSSAYLSVSIFILGLILYQLSEVDRPVRWFQIDSINTYRYIKHPKQLGEIFFTLSYMLLSLLLPYGFIYSIIGLAYIIYIKKVNLFKET
ncbi:hypothetical protein RW115_06420 [Macrococcus capreoli]